MRDILDKYLEKAEKEFENEVMRVSYEMDTKKTNELDSIMAELLNKNETLEREKLEKEREDRRRFNELGPKEYLIEKVLKVYPNLDRATLEKKSYSEIQEDLFNGVYLWDSDSTDLESLLG